MLRRDPKIFLWLSEKPVPKFSSLTHRLTPVFSVTPCETWAQPLAIFFHSLVYSSLATWGREVSLSILAISPSFEDKRVPCDTRKDDLYCETLCFLFCEHFFSPAEIQAQVFVTSANTCDRGIFIAIEESWQEETGNRQDTTILTFVLYGPVGFEGYCMSIHGSLS